MASSDHDQFSVHSRQDQVISVPFNDSSVGNSAVNSIPALSDIALEHENDILEPNPSTQGSTASPSFPNVYLDPVRNLENVSPTSQSTNVEVHDLESTVETTFHDSQQQMQSESSVPVRITSTTDPVTVHSTVDVSLQSPSPGAFANGTQISSPNTTVHDIIVPVQASIFTNPAPGTSSAAQTRVSPEDENVLKYFIMLRPTGPAAKVLSKVCRDLYLGGENSVKDYCINSLGLSNADYRKIFTAHERQTLDAGTSWDTLDITFLYKLLQRVCGLAPPSNKKWANPDPQESDDIEHSLYQIKGERNFLAHETVTLTDLQLEQRSQRLRILLANVLSKSAMRIKTDNSQDVVNMKCAIEEILHSATSLSLQVYQKELEDMRSKLVNRVVKESRCELFERYLYLWSSGTIFWSQTHTLSADEGYNTPKIEKVFTNITITEKNGNEITLQEMFGHCLSNGSLPRLLIIEGIAGIGKSHLCKYVLYKWASQNADEVNLHEVDVIIFIECNSVNSGTLREYLCEEFLPRSCHSLRHEDVIPALQNCDTFFIIDGLDEASRRAKSIIREINTKFPSSRVLITCRPEFTEEAKLLITANQNFSVFHVKGFSDLQRKEYLDKLLTIIYNKRDENDTSSETLHHKIREMEQYLFSLLCLPLTVTLLVLLLLEDAESLSFTKTATHIYQRMVDMRIKQVAERIHRKPSETRHITLIERTCNKWLKDLTKVAWETLMLNTHILDDKCTAVLLEKALDYNIDPMDVMSSFLKCKMFGTKYVWEFFHKAFQEYLSASYLSSTTTEEVRESYRMMYGENVPNQLIKKGPNNHSITSLQDIYITLSEYEGFRLKSAGIKRAKLNCFSLFLSCFQNICNCKNASDKRSEPRSYGYMSNDIKLTSLLSDTIHFEMDADIQVENESNSSEFTSLQGELQMFRGAISSRNIISSSKRDSFSRSRSRSQGRNRSQSQRSRSRSRSRDEISLADESPYEIGISLDDDAQKKLGLQNTLQFLGAMEASKQEVDHDKLKDIVDRYYQSTSLHRWSAWATLIRECQEHPLVCQLVQPYLNGNRIRGWDAHQGMTDYLKTIEYLLKKTEFVPENISLWITGCISFPGILGSVLSTFGEILPTMVTELKCFTKHCSKLHQTLAQMKRLDLIDLTVMGSVEKSQSDDFVGLMKFLHEKEVEFKLTVTICNTENLATFANCCMVGGLPRKTELELFVWEISDEMLKSLCQILKAFSWVKSFTFAFTDANLFDEIAIIQQLLIKALEQVSIQLTNVELIVEIHAQNRTQSYEDMAQAVAGGIPVAVTFNDWTDGDDIRLLLHGIPK